MKKLISYIVIISISLHSLQNVGIIISFKLNQDYIAKVLCINKDNVEKKCNGKCHLKKQLTKKSEEEKQQTTSFQFREIQLMKQDSNELLSKDFPIENKKIIKICSNEPSQGFYHTIFHPPKVL